MKWNLTTTGNQVLCLLLKSWFTAVKESLTERCLTTDKNTLEIQNSCKSAWCASREGLRVPPPMLLLENWGYYNLHVQKIPGKSQCIVQEAQGARHNDTTVPGFESIHITCEYSEGFLFFFYFFCTGCQIMPIGSWIKWCSGACQSVLHTQFRVWILFSGP